jgi:hypothetical protein
MRLLVGALVCAGCFFDVDSVPRPGDGGADAPTGGSGGLAGAGGMGGTGGTSGTGGSGGMRPDAGLGTLTFGSAMSVPCGANPEMMVVADLDGNGTDDIATLNIGNSTVSVLLQAGNGLFTVGPDYNVASGLQTIAVGDADGDGLNDLLAGDFSTHNVLVLHNPPASPGQFQNNQTLAVPNAPTAIVVTDVQPDGIPDVLVTNGSFVSVFLGTGGGNFGNRVDYSTGAGPVAIVAGRYVGDSNIDVITGSATLTELSILTQPGNGVFTNSALFGTGAKVTAMASRDIDGDSRADIAIVTQATGLLTVAWQLASSSGGFDSTLFSMPTGNGTPDPHDVKLADLDNDGHMDIVVANFGAQNVMVFAQGPGRQFRTVPVPTGVLTSAVGVGDFNGDGLPDLAVANGSTPGAVLIFHQR